MTDTLSAALHGFCSTKVLRQTNFMSSILIYSTQLWVLYDSSPTLFLRLSSNKQFVCSNHIISHTETTSWAAFSFSKYRQISMKLAVIEIF